MATDSGLVRVGERLITLCFRRDRIAEACETAASPQRIKAVVEQEAPA